MCYLLPMHITASNVYLTDTTRIWFKTVAYVSKLKLSDINNV